MILPPITEGFIKYFSGEKGLMNKTPKIIVIVKGCPSLMLAMSMKVGVGDDSDHQLTPPHPS